MGTPDDILTYNRQAWDRQVERGNPWTVPVGQEELARAGNGDWRIVLTPTKPVPSAWFPPLVGLDVLCLASGGGQQGPILAAAGANVTVFETAPSNSPRTGWSPIGRGSRSRLSKATWQTCPCSPTPDST